MGQNYKRYDYLENNSYVGKVQQIKDYLDGKFERITIDKEFIDSSIKESLKDVDENIAEVVQTSVQESVTESLQDIDATIKTSVQESVTESLQDIDEQFDKVNDNIRKATEVIINEIDINKPCLCGLATKEDINVAIQEINTHTTHSLEEYNFNEQFTNLNEEIRKLQEKTFSLDPDIAKVLSSITNVEEDKFKDNVDSDINKEDISLNMGVFDESSDDNTF